MHILNIIQCTNLGGMEQSNLLRLTGLKARGHSVNLVSLNALGELGPKLDEANIPSIGLEYQGLFGWRTLPKMRGAFLSQKADAVLMTGHNLAATFVLLGVKSFRKVLSIHHYHHSEGKQGVWRWKIYYRLAKHVFDHVTFASGFIREEALHIYPHLERMSSVVPNPFVLPLQPSDAEKREARRTMGLTDDVYIVGNAGWLIPTKRFDVFLRVAAKVIASYPNTLFLIAGDGPEKENLLLLAQDLGIGDAIRFLGWRPDLTDFYKVLDVMLFNSDSDALGRTPAEAASYGVPVVASIVRGGLSELFRSADEALVLPEHDIDAMSGAIGNLLSCRSTRHRAGQRARQRVADYGDVDSHAANMERLLSR